MSRILYVLTVLSLIFMSKTLINCQSKNDFNSRLSRAFERHSESVRQYLCEGKGITGEQWVNLKTDCINPRINELLPKNAVNVWQNCSEGITDLCDDQHWMDGKECVKGMVAETDIRGFHVWHNSRVKQIRANFQIIKNCYQMQRKKA